MKAEQNRVSKLIPQYKKEGKDVAPILAEMKELSDKITEDGAKLAELDVDAVVVLPFSREFAAQSPEDFLNACFGGGVPSHIHIGSDFHFGRKAAGNVESLRVWGAERGMEVHGHELVAEGGRPVTATRIRGLLSEGRAREAADLLGRPYELSGLVRPGRGEGRDFGFATANLEVPPLLLAVGEGVYACYAVVNGARYKAAVNVGIPATLPTLPDSFSLQSLR